MKVIQTWTLAADTPIPTSVALADDDSLWLANWSTSLLHLIPRETAVTVNPTENSADIVAISRGPHGSFWLIADDGQSRVGLWQPGQIMSQLTLLTAEPRQIAWDSGQQVLWYLGTDLSLHVYSKGKEDQQVDVGKYTGLVVSESGRHIAVRQSATEDLLVAPTETLAWRTVRTQFTGELAGFGPDGELFLLQPGLAKKGQMPDEGVLLAVSTERKEQKVTKDNIIYAYAQGSKLVLVTREANGRMKVTLQTLAKADE
jgi:hypothetical protein